METMNIILPESLGRSIIIFRICSSIYLLSLAPKTHWARNPSQPSTAHRSGPKTVCSFPHCRALENRPGGPHRGHLVIDTGAAMSAAVTASNAVGIDRGADHGRYAATGRRDDDLGLCFRQGHPSQDNQGQQSSVRFHGTFSRDGKTSSGTESARRTLSKDSTPVDCLSVSAG
jgi:hypothetical protein